MARGSQEPGPQLDIVVRFSMLYLASVLSATPFYLYGHLH